LKTHGVTLTTLLTRAAGLALAQHPLLHARLTEDGTGIEYAEGIHVANAVAMPGGGLITPVLRDADSTDVYSLSRAWRDLVQRARGKQLRPEEYSGATFTISNLGMYGVDSFDAVLPPGTAAILAVGGGGAVVAADEQNRICVERQMTLNLTADHRIVYGAHAAEFLVTLKKVLESPEQLLY
ncbi:2-oxoacid dehydrogenases acyltransferase, partial [Helicosporidium sp. ATCC 50920]